MESTVRVFFNRIYLVPLAALILLVLLALPTMFAIASPPGNQEKVDPSGVWEITLHDPGGWLASGLSNGKYWQTAEVWETANNQPIMKPQDYVYRLDLTVEGTKISGKYQCKTYGGADCTLFTPSGDLSEIFTKTMASGEITGTLSGNSITLKLGQYAELSGTVSATAMEGSGTLLHYRIEVDSNNYTDIPDRPVTFTTSSHESLIDCQVKISTPDNLTPGDDLWVSATFFDPDGKEIVPRSHAYYINGKEITSVEWDGQPARIEVQYTCPNGKTKTEKLTIPAYAPPKLEQESKEKEKADAGKPPAEQGKPKGEEKSEPVQEKSKTENAEKNPGGIDLEQAANIAVVAGGMLTAVSGAVGAGLVIKTLAEAVKGANLAKDAAAVAQAPAEAAPVEVQSEPQPTEASRPPRSKPGDERITSAEKAKLQQRLNDLEARQVELAQRQDILRQTQQQVYRSRERMRDFYQRNALRVILRLGYETHQYLEILYNPGRGAIQLISQLTQEAVDRALQAPPQGATDAQILETQRQNIRRLGDEIQNVKRLRHEANVEHEKNLREMEKIRNRLKNAVELPFE